MESNTYLTFVLGQEIFGVNVQNVLEVLEQQYITPVPQAPAHILGIINFRGEIIPVINTRVKFNLGEMKNQEKSYVIVYNFAYEDQNHSIAATADAVKDVIEIKAEEIKQVPEMGIAYDTRFITGVVRRNDQFILLLNSSKIFSHTDIENISI